MKTRSSSTRRVVGTAVLTAVGLVGTIGGVSYAADSHGSTAVTKAAHHKGGLLGRAEYGQVVVRRHKKDVTLDVQRGTLTAVDLTGASTGTITVRSLDGHSQTYSLAAASHVRSKGATIADSTLKTGDRVGVLATVSGSTATVTRLAVRPAAVAKSATSASPSS